MVKIGKKKREKIFTRVRKLLNIKPYIDFNKLDFDELMEKYGHVGDGIHNATEVGFRTQHAAFAEVRKLLNTSSEYYFIPVTEGAETYNVTGLEINCYMDEHVDNPGAHFIIVHPWFEWILLKDDFNKVIGLGDIIKGKMKLLQVDFDEKNVMYLLNY